MQVLNTNELNQVYGGLIPVLLIGVTVVIAFEIYNTPPAY
ncbi:MAG: bacteriocin [Cardiobacteriaceae bacterium]|nr:bacteriocin [Cardiobacteriaceae bacterium]